MDIFVFAQLDGTQTLIKLLAPRTGFFAKVVALASLGIVETFDGADDSSSAASTGFLELGKFINSDGATFHLHAHILGQLHEALVGDGGQDGSALGSDIGVVLNAEEVGSAGLVDILLLLGIEIELAGI